MKRNEFLAELSVQLQQIQTEGLYKHERVIRTPQNASIQLEDGKEVINLCANNYLGLADHPEFIAQAKEALNEYGYGMSSVRFICGTQTVHKELEARLSQFLGTDDTILYSSCFDANGGLFETILTEADAVISDSLNHASIIDGIRLCKAKRYRYQNNDMQDLATQLQRAVEDKARVKLIVTDGVFSMDGSLANLPAICALADQHDALVMVDDSHAVGFMGDTGRGTHEYHHVMGRIDIITGTLGKALGGASGGYTSGRKEIIDWLRQRSRPYLFSNTLAPTIAATSIKVIEYLETHPELQQRLHANTRYFRAGLTDLGFDLLPGEHPIVPIMLGDARLANEMANLLLQEGVYVIGFSYPVVPMGKARIRTQLSAALTQAHLDQALTAFANVGRKLKITQGVST